MQSFREDLERSEQDGTEWQFGVVTKDLAAVPVSLRLLELPAGVLQYNNIMDTVGCASRGPNNILETKLDYFYDNGMHPDIKKWFDQNGYRVNGKFALCDAFIEILSGTTPTGNSLKAPLEAIRKNGAIPAALIPLEDGMNWAEYMDKKRLTQAHKDLGQEFLKRITINYEQVYVSGFEKAVDVDLLDTALSAWSLPVDGVYPPIEGPFNHCVARVTNEIDIFDNYVPFVKRLAKNYKFFDWGYSISITAQNPNPDIQTTVFDVLKKNGLLAYFADWLVRFINATANPPPLTPPPPPIPTNSWDTPAKAWKSTRILCDSQGLTFAEKQLICAVIMRESGFRTRASGENRDALGRLLSTDWGICQINDYYNIGVGKPFTSVEEVLNNPEKCVRFMITCYKEGHLFLWSAYKNGSYRQYLNLSTAPV